jgi:hypothetical protein
MELGKAQPGVLVGFLGLALPDSERCIFNNPAGGNSSNLNKGNVKPKGTIPTGLEIITEEFSVSHG